MVHYLLVKKQLLLTVTNVLELTISYQLKVQEDTRVDYLLENL